MQRQWRKQEESVQQSAEQRLTAGQRRRRNIAARKTAAATLLQRQVKVRRAELHSHLVTGSCREPPRWSCGFQHGDAQISCRISFHARMQHVKIEFLFEDKKRAL